MAALVCSIIEGDPRTAFARVQPAPSIEYWRASSTMSAVKDRSLTMRAAHSASSNTVGNTPHWPRSIKTLSSFCRGCHTHRVAGKRGSVDHLDNRGHHHCRKRVLHSRTHRRTRSRNRMARPRLTRRQQHPSPRRANSHHITHTYSRHVDKHSARTDNHSARTGLARHHRGMHSRAMPVQRRDIHSRATPVQRRPCGHR
jgi:hypothetical protein